MCYFYYILFAKIDWHSQAKSSPVKAKLGGRPEGRALDNESVERGRRLGGWQITLHKGEQWEVEGHQRGLMPPGIVCQTARRLAFRQCLADADGNIAPVSTSVMLEKTRPREFFSSRDSRWPEFGRDWMVYGWSGKCYLGIGCIK